MDMFRSPKRRNRIPFNIIRRILPKRDERPRIKQILLLAGHCNLKVTMGVYINEPMWMCCKENWADINLLLLCLFVIYLFNTPVCLWCTCDMFWFFCSFSHTSCHTSGMICTQKRWKREPTFTTSVYSFCCDACRVLGLFFTCSAVAAVFIHRTLSQIHDT